jgi:hypothetical protein
METQGRAQSETAQLKPQDPSSGPEARAGQRVGSGPESQSSAADAIGPKAENSTPGEQSPDYSLPTPFDWTKAVSTRRVEGSQNPNPIKDSQEGNGTGSGVNNDAEPDDTTDSLSQQPGQTQGIEAGASVHDSKRPDTSADKGGEEADQDLTKVANEKGVPPKADANLSLAHQLVPQGRAEVGGASPEASGTSQSRGQADSASVAERYQAYAGRLVSSARFTDQGGNAEMQVRLRSEALGPIDVHTIVNGSDIGASIRVEARDTQVMLANELPQLERALNERSLRVEHLDVLQGSVSGGGPDMAGSGNSQESPSEPRRSFPSYSSDRSYTSLPTAQSVTEDWELGLSTTRINLRA